MDLKKMANSVGATFNRVVQLTEEKIGNAEKTEYDPHFLNLCRKAEQTTKWTEKIVKGVEAMLQPNPAMRMEEFVMTKLDKKKDHVTLPEDLGHSMIEAGNELGPGSTYGNALIKCGQTEGKIGMAEKSLIAAATSGFIAPLRKFLDEDMKTIEREQKTLENKRIDLDAAKLKVKRAKTDQAKRSLNDDAVAKAESEEAVAQSAFDKQMETTRLLLEKVESFQMSAEAHHVQCLNELIDCQMTYYAQCHQLMQELQRQLGSYAYHGNGGSVTTGRGSFSSSKPAAPGLVPLPLDYENREARVLYDYRAADSSELTIVTDELLTIYIDRNAGPDPMWYVAERGFERGKVPAAYVELIK